MNAIQFIQQHGVDKAREVVEGAPETATHFTEALGGHYAKEGMLKMKPQWLWFNSINKEWYFDFAAKEHIHLPELKRLVESMDLINTQYDGLENAKELLRISPKLTDELRFLGQAIEDYDSIYKCRYCNGFGEVGCQFEGTFTCPDCNGDRYVGGEHV